ncbi:MAG: hypothetical protein Kow00127_04030 [Bacteroidales bacterium]
MKKIYLFICLFGLSGYLFSQTYLLEDFSAGQMPPSGWTIDNLSGQWSINNGNNAGGIAPEAMFSWVSGINTSRLISPQVDLTGLSSVSFQFSHFLDDYSGTGYTLGVATRSGGGDWNTVWSVNPDGNIGPETVSFEITNSDVGAADFQICIYIDGNTYNLDYWYIDDIWLFLPLNLDAGMMAITTPQFLGEPTPVEGVIKNFGSTEITSCSISYQVDDGDIITTDLDGFSIAFGETYSFTCDGLLDLPIGTYNLSVWIETVNGVADDDPDNNLATKTLSVVSHTTAHRPCLEEFTSSTCSPCAAFNQQFVPWCNDHDDQITLVKYQMNWPGSGDPYYTEEGGVRRDYYGVTWVPWTNLDGTYTDNSIPTIESMFNQSLNEPGLIKVIGSNSSVTGDGTEMDIVVTLLPFAAFQDVLVSIAVFEYETVQNVGTNGETSFEHVMMKMVPDGYGTTVDLQDRVPFTISETVDLAGTNVEEWDDLGVAIIVQDASSKYVWQSDYCIENGEFATDATLANLTVDGETIAGFSPDVFDYTVTLPLGTVEVPEVEAFANDLAATTIVVPATELPGATTVDVFAEDLATHLTYTVNFDISTGSSIQKVDAVRVYPNPTQGSVYIAGVKDARVSVFNTSGSEVAVYNHFNSGRIDLGGLDEGIYFLRVVMDDKNIINKKISLIK